MAKIIKFDSTRRKPEAVSRKTSGTCEHKNVIAYTVYRTVRCAICGVELDPFDVLVDMLKAYVPQDDNREDVRLQKEVRRRSETESE